MSDEKEILREQALQHRARIDPASVNPEDAVALFFKNVNPHKKQVVAAYWPKGDEFDCSPVLEELLKKKFACALPVIQEGSRVLQFAKWTQKDNLVKGPFGIMQPEITKKTKWVEPDIVLVPILAFDRRGNRLGYGGGYYDTTLRVLREKKEILAVGMGYAQQAVLFNLPAEPHDERLDWIITPKSGRAFRKR